jgi:CDP-paratose 2-epimerase
MKILITGICGFVGSALAKTWLKAETGLELYGLDNLLRPGSEENRRQIKKLGIEFYHGDVRIASDFEALPRVDWIIDAAANPSVLSGVDGNTSSRQLIEHNLMGTINMLEYCKKHSAGFIMLSTSRVYAITQLSELVVKSVNQAFRLSAEQILPLGLSAEGVSEKFSTEAPISLYGSTKLASEMLALEYSASFNFPVFINRCGVMAGAGQFGKPDQGIFSYWINAYLRRKPLKYIGFGGNGFQVRDCFHPRDLIPLLQQQTSKPCGYKARIVNIGGGNSHAMSLAELSAWCADRFGSHSISTEPAIRRFDIPWMIMDCRLANQTWGWSPQTSLDQILDEIACHAEQHPNWLNISGA